MNLDVNFNFQEALGDSNKDPDKYSKVLQNYHQLLWSKTLPNGKLFHLDKLNKSCLLAYPHPSGEMLLSSDRVVPTFSRWKQLEPLISQIPQEELCEFKRAVETIGAITIWPSARIDKQKTINGDRGLNNRICDRIDLTLECIRRYYLGEISPLFDTLQRYRTFFDLFHDFRGYIDFFLFQDFVSDDYKSVIISPPYDNFISKPVPKDEAEYITYMHQILAQVRARNQRITEYASHL